MFNLTSYITELVSLIKIRAFDTSTQQGRSKERYRRITINSLSFLCARGSGFLVSIISIPLTLHYLGSERFGLWMTLSSLLVFIGFLDLGLGNGLVNAISQAHGKDNTEEARKVVSNAFFILCAQALLVGLIAVFINPLLNWQTIYNLHSKADATEAGLASQTLLFIFLLSLPFTLVLKVQEGYQEAFINNIYQICGSFLGLVCILLIIYFHGGIAWLVFSFAGVPFFAVLINYVVQFYYYRPYLRPSFAFFEKKEAISLLKAGGVFFLLNLLTMIGFQTDNLVISNVLGAAAVAEYALVQRLSLIAYFLWAFLIHLWPAYGEAIARKDYYWVRMTIKRATWISLAGGILIGSIITLFGQSIIKIWVGNKIAPHFSLFFGFSFFILLNGFIGVIASVLNSCYLYRLQVLPFFLATVTALLLKVILAKTFGLNYVIWGTIVGYSIFYIIPGALIIKRQFWLSDKIN